MLTYVCIGIDVIEMTKELPLDPENKLTAQSQMVLG